MKINRDISLVFSWCALIALPTGCRKTPASTPVVATTPHAHEHTPPHGGTPVVLGDELYHLELVLDAGTGTLQAFVFDGEMENFVRIAERELTVVATVNGTPQMLVLKAVANAATGETVGDTALFEAQADWLKTTREFDGRLKSVIVRGTTFQDVGFKFPAGNENP